ncbi:MAG: ribonuclease Z [Methanobrevibacter sp.]|jgi:ribonuclease Z|nr:ribonuclease Z [Candidatus Methanovirga basalitermitum]
MELIFLGTSSAIPSRHRNHPSIGLKAFGEVILFDCGEGTQRQLIFAKISPMKITKIFISHLHGDHVLGLPGLIESLGFRGRTEPLDVYGPPGIFNLEIAINNLGSISKTFVTAFHEVEGRTIIDNDDYIIQAIKTHHNIYNLSYSIVEKKKPRFLRKKAIKLGVKPGTDFGKLHNGETVKVNNKIISPEQVLGKNRSGIKISYSGDTKPSDDLVDFVKDSNLLIHESTYQQADEDKANEHYHSTGRQAAEIAKKANVDRLILTHISSRYKNVDKIREEACEVFENTDIASDFLKIELNSN